MKIEKDERDNEKIQVNEREKQSYEIIDCQQLRKVDNSTSKKKKNNDNINLPSPSIKCSI